MKITIDTEQIKEQVRDNLERTIERANRHRERGKIERAEKWEFSILGKESLLIELGLLTADEMKEIIDGLE